MIANAIFLKIVLTLKGYSVISVFLGKSGIYVFKSAQYICQFTSPDFHIIPGGFCSLPGGLPYLPSGNLLLGFTPKNFLKFDIFPGESSSPHRGTETGCTKAIYIDVVVVSL